MLKYLFIVELMLLLRGVNGKPITSHDYAYFDVLRNRSTSHANVTHSNSLYQVITTQGVTFRLAELKLFLPLSNNGTAIRVGLADEAFTALLAMHHWNHNYAKNDFEDCNVRMTMEILDTHFSPIVTTRAFTSLLQRQTSLTNPPATAVVGAYRSAVTSPLALLSGVNDIPQISHASTSLDFDVKQQFPLFGRTVTSSIGEASIALKYFQSIGSSHVAILFLTDSYGSALQKVMADEATAFNIATVSFAVSFDASFDMVRSVMQQLQASSIRHVYAIFYEQQFETFTAAANEYDLFGPDYLWLFPGFDLDAIVRSSSSYKVGSPVTKALNGAAIVTMQGGATSDTLFSSSKDMEQGGGSTGTTSFVDPTSGYSKFRDTWDQAYKDTNFGDYVRSKLPTSLDAIPGFDRSHVKFSKEPGSFRPFMYDTITALGVSMCRAGNSSSYLFSGHDIYEQFRKLDLQGASGHVKIDHETGTRDYKTISFVIWNVRALPVEESSNEIGYSVFSFVPALLYENDQWIPIADNDFIYTGGSEVAPDSLPPVDMNYNYIGSAARVAGYVLMGITVCTAIVSLIWLVLNHNKTVVTIAQPLFLCLVSTGAIFMAMTIVPLSMDETTTNSNAGLDVACMVSPYLYAIGISMAVGALLAKVIAVYQAYMKPDLEFIQISSKGIILTCFSLILLNVVVLLTWTLVSPLEWTREVQGTRDKFNRPTESFARCKSEHGRIFVIVLCVLNAAIVIFAVVGCFRSRNVETEFEETRYIWISLATFLQAFCIGLPILIVVNDNPEGRFLVETGVIFVTAQAVVSLIYLPKMMALRKAGQNASSSRESPERSIISSSRLSSN